MESPSSETTHDATSLERLLADFIEAHESLLEATRAQREAISGADPGRLSESTRRIGEVIERIARLEQRRREVVVEMLRAHPTLARPGAQPTLEGLCPPERDRHRHRTHGRPRRPDRPAPQP